jgi:histone-lysine N-methyltransferase SUV420H
LSIPEEDIVPVLEGVAERQDEAAAVSRILKLLCLRGYLSELSKPLHFQAQLKLYVNIFLPDCPFEINITTRYSTAPEACITARKPIKEGVIKYLSGYLVLLTEEEEQTLTTTNRDFTIVTSSRKKGISIFLGPGRFANHDCEANAKFSTTEDGMQVVAMRNINVSEEITVIYESHYFSENNRECLCDLRILAA